MCNSLLSGPPVAFRGSDDFSNVHRKPIRAIIPAMGESLLSRFLSSCHHQFSWPRRDDAGEYYQLCVHCGLKYQYDWARMRRIAPIEDAVADTASSSMRRCGKKTAWTPRERRLRHSVPVQCRAAGSDTWTEGVTENISRSGLLFRITATYEPGTNLELKFEMPKELTGEASAEVIAHGTVARVTQPQANGKRGGSYLVACSIVGYDFGIAPKPATSESKPIIEISRRVRRH